MMKSDGTKCITTEENAEVFRIHFEKLFDRMSEYTRNFDTIPQVNAVQEYNEVPDDEEIEKVCRSLKDKAPGESGLLSQLWKTFFTEDSTFQILKSLILDF